MATAFRQMEHVRLKNERDVTPEDRPVEAPLAPGLAREPLAKECSWVHEESWDGTARWSTENLDEAEIRRTVEEAVRRGRMTDSETRKPLGKLRAPGLLVDDTPRRAGVVPFGRADRPPQCLCARIRGCSGHVVHGGSWNLSAADLQAAIAAGVSTKSEAPISVFGLQGSR